MLRRFLLLLILPTIQGRNPVRDGSLFLGTLVGLTLGTTPSVDAFVVLPPPTSWVVQRHPLKLDSTEARIYAFRVQRGGSKGSWSVIPEKGVDSSLYSMISSSYALVWSPGFVKKFGITSAGLLALHFAGISDSLGRSLFSVLQRFANIPKGGFIAATMPNVILPLLSSSCCLLQVLINISVGASGCAGFNTYLGPIRPGFLALFLYLNMRSMPTLGQAFLRGLLVFLPELIHGYNWVSGMLWEKKHRAILEDDKSMVRTVIDIAIPTMGCVACINKVESSLRQSDPTHILEATAWLDGGTKKGGRARVVLALPPKYDVHMLQNSVVKAIDGAGFLGSEVVSLERQPLLP